MAGYGHTNRGYTGYNSYDEPRFPGNGERDHICRPVLVDAEGRKHPIVSYSQNPSNGNYIKKTEIIEEVIAPVATDNKYRPHEDYVNHDRPEKVEGFITKIQTEVNRPPARISGLSTWRQKAGSPTRNEITEYIRPHSPSQNSIKEYRERVDYIGPRQLSHNGITEYGERPEQYGPPSNGVKQYAERVEYIRKNNGTLSQPTSNINNAIEYLKEAASSPSPAAAWPRDRFMVPTPVVARRETRAEVIDSNEAARRYGKYMVPN